MASFQDRVSSSVNAFVGCKVTDWGPRQEPYPLPCLMALKISGVDQELTLCLGSDMGNAFSIWIDDEPTSYEYFLEHFLKTVRDGQDVVVKNFHVDDPILTATNGIERWTGHVRLELQWDGQSLVLGNLTTDLGVGRILQESHSSSRDDFSLFF